MSFNCFFFQMNYFVGCNLGAAPSNTGPCGWTSAWEQFLAVPGPDVRWIVNICLLCEHTWQNSLNGYISMYCEIQLLYCSSITITINNITTYWFGRAWENCQGSAYWMFDSACGRRYAVWPATLPAPSRFKAPDHAIYCATFITASAYHRHDW